MAASPAQQITLITQEFDFMLLENSQKEQKNILSSQETTKEQTGVHAQTLYRQSYVCAAIFAFQMCFIAGVIAGVALNSAPAADANNGTFNFQRVPTTPFAKISEFARDALKNHHERLLDLSRTVEAGSKAIDYRFENTKNLANARVKEEELKVQQSREDKARYRSGAEEIERLRSSMANSEAASMRSGS